MVHETDKTSAGIHLDANGDRVFGGTLRADGSVRKTVKVRPGFIPKEDVQRYDPREAAERRKQREESDDRKDMGPGQRQNRTLAAINDALGGGSSSSRVPHTRGERKNNKGSELSDDLSSKIANLSIENRESPSKSSKIQSKHATTNPTSETDKEPSKPKKYRPSRPKTKKYSLADLDNA